MDRSFWSLLRRRQYNAAQRLEEQRQLMEVVGPEGLEFLRARQRRLIARRELLRRSAMGVGGAGLAALFAACGAGTSSTSSTSTGTAAAGGKATGSATAGATQAPFETIGKATFRREDYPTYAGKPTFKSDATISVGSVVTDPSPLDMVTGLIYYYGTGVWMYDWLIDLDPVTLDVIPCVAEAWEISPDQKTYTFHLRSGPKFWDGSPVTAEDVKFTMLAYRDEPQSQLASVYKPIDTIDTPDPKTVVVHLSQKFAPFLAWGGQMFIGKKAAFDGFSGHMQDAPAAKTTPVGSGPWKFVEAVPGSHAKFTANRDWWRGAGWKQPGAGGPYYGTLIQRFYADYQSWLVGFLGGEVDTLYPVDVKDVETLGKVDTWIYDTPSTVSEGMVFNFANPDRANKTLFDDVNVRKALYYAVDVQAMGKAVWKGFWEPRTNDELHPWMLKPYKDQIHYDYDPKKAKDMLAKAGWTPGSDGILQKGNDKFSIVGVSAKSYLAPQYAQVVQQYFKDIGVKMDLQVLDSAPLRQVVRKDFKFDVYFKRHWGWGYPESFRDVMVKEVPPEGYNYGHFSDTAPGGLEDLWGQLLVTASEEEAKPLFYKLEDREAEILPALYFGSPHDVVAIRKNVLGHQPNPMWQDWDPMWWYQA